METFNVMSKAIHVEFNKTKTFAYKQVSLQFSSKFLDIYVMNNFKNEKRLLPQSEMQIK